MTMIEARPYQTALVNTGLNWLRGGRNNFALEAPPGSGKSLMSAWLAKAILDHKERRRVLVLCSISEIIRQDAIEIARVLPLGQIGAACANTGSFNVHGCKVLVASLQTIRTRLSLLDGVTHVIIDEAHGVGPEEGAMYNLLFAFLRQRCAADGKTLKIIGLTGTPFRLDQGHLANGKGLFKEVPYAIGTAELIQLGYLAKPINHAIPSAVTFDPSDIPSGDDYSLMALERAMAVSGVTGRALDDAVERVGSMSTILAFCVSIAHAEAAAAHLNARGVVTRAVHSKMSRDDRRMAIELFKLGKVRALASVSSLTTGFNATNVRCIIGLRPTKSFVLDRQMRGRGMRIEPGKSEFHMLDYVGNTDAHGDIATDNGSPLYKVKSIKTCGACGAHSPTKVSRCSCGSKMGAAKPVLTIAKRHFQRAA